jgi:hypothetical protein
MGRSIPAVPRQEVVALLGFNPHLFVVVEETGLIALVLDLLLAVGTERLQTCLSWLQTMLRKGSPESIRDLRGKWVEMR